MILSEKLNKCWEEINLPEESYAIAKGLYQDLAEWLSNAESSLCAAFSPNISPQGSQRYGAANKPLSGDQFDVDLHCSLSEGLTNETITQSRLKHMLGVDIESYREERGIKKEKEEKHRCWRLEYHDRARLHLDAVPSIPGSKMTVDGIVSSIREVGAMDSDLIEIVNQHVVQITDNRLPNYDQLAGEWPVSNPEGFALWLLSRVRSSTELFERRMNYEKAASVDDFPVFKWKMPLQKVIQLLKRHRDVMFEDDPDGAPISIIITTLAGWSYSGESDLWEAFSNVIKSLRHYVSPVEPRISNPVNPNEDFSDRWRTRRGVELNLEGNFWNWIDQVERDLMKIQQLDGVNLDEYLGNVFKVNKSDLPQLAAGVRNTHIKSPRKPHGN